MPEERTILSDGTIFTYKDIITKGIWGLCPLCEIKIRKSFGSVDSMIADKGEKPVKSFGNICQECFIKYDAHIERRYQLKNGTYSEWKIR